MEIIPMFFAGSGSLDFISKLYEHKQPQIGVLDKRVFRFVPMAMRGNFSTASKQGVLKCHLLYQ